MNVLLLNYIINHGTRLSRSTTTTATEADFNGSNYSAFPEIWKYIYSGAAVHQEGKMPLGTLIP